MNLTENDFNDILKKSHLQEQLVPAKLQDLEKAMLLNPALHAFLTTKAKDLPSDYLFLVQEITEEDKNTTLLDIIKISLTWHVRRTQIKCFFSKIGDALVGFAAYVIKANEVIEIKMFSFNPDRPNPVLIRDLKELLITLLQQYKKVSWSAMEQNKANIIYQKAIEEFDGTKYSEDGIVFYTCNQKSKQDLK